MALWILYALLSAFFASKVKNMITVYEVLEHLRKIEYVGCLGIKTVTDAVNFYVAIKTSRASRRP